MLGAGVSQISETLQSRYDVAGSWLMLSPEVAAR
jgi:hypothetical protein